MIPWNYYSLLHECYFSSIFDILPKIALIVYRLIDTTLIGKIFDDPFLFETLNLTL